MKGYKAFNKDLVCRNFQFEIGKTYKIDDEIEICKKGFHFCKTLVDCYRYYDATEDTRICEIEAIGEIKTDDNIKYCTNEIIIKSEIENPRIKTNLSYNNNGYCNNGSENDGNWNCGNWNSGNGNCGDRNSGNGNSGNQNSGNWNCGYQNRGSWNCGSQNSGCWNSGNMNIGNGNCGDRNTGNRNTGDKNSGNCNTGNWNSGYYNSGVFNTDKNPKIKIFDKQSDWTIGKWFASKAFDIMKKCPYSYITFIASSEMSDSEKENHPKYNILEGYFKMIKVTDEDRQKWWNELPESDKLEIYNLPNFDADKFEECTGIKVKIVN